MRIHPTEDEDTGQALQLQVGLGPPFRILDLLPHLQKGEGRQAAEVRPDSQGCYFLGLLPSFREAQVFPV